MYVFNLGFSALQAALARLEALENDNAGMEVVENIDDEDASLDDDDQGYSFIFFPLWPFSCRVLSSITSIKC